jgi:hypothetical protein
MQNKWDKFLVGVLTILKNMCSSMGRMTSHILWKIKFMFETTNQISFVVSVLSGSNILVSFIPKPPAWTTFQPLVVTCALMGWFFH